MLEWAKDKTILVIDMKEVPIELCMIGSSRSVDKEYQAGKIGSYAELMERYKGPLDVPGAVVAGGVTGSVAGVAVDAGAAAGTDAGGGGGGGS
jgi:hypothetical protein